MNEPEKPKLPLLAKEYDTCARSYFVIEDGNGRELSDEEFLWIREAANNHDRLTKENAKLRKEKESLLHELCAIQNACIGEIAMGYNLDAEQIGSDISIATGMTNPELNEFLKDQNNDK